MLRSQLARLLSEIQPHIPQGSGLPVNLGTFRAGQTFAVKGYSFGPRPTTSS
jgi:hypothetical protein